MARQRTHKQQFPLSRIYQDDLEARFMHGVYAWADQQQIDLKTTDGWAILYLEFFPEQRLPGEIEDYIINKGGDLDGLYTEAGVKF